MKLSELQGRGRNRADRADQSFDDPTQTGQIRNAVAYPRPFDALIEGKAVKVLATADIAGLSPACQYVDENGHIDWASSEDLTVFDTQLVPQPQQQRERLQRGTTLGQNR